MHRAVHFGDVKRAGIVDEFANLLDITTRLPGNAMATIQHMRPLERLGDGSNHTVWMAEYLTPSGDHQETCAFLKLP